MPYNRYRKRSKSRRRRRSKYRKRSKSRRSRRSKSRRVRRGKRNSAFHYAMLGLGLGLPIAVGGIGYGMYKNKKKWRTISRIVERITNPKNEFRPQTAMRRYLNTKTDWYNFLGGPNNYGEYSDEYLKFLLNDNRFDENEIKNIMALP